MTKQQQDVFGVLIWAIVLALVCYLDGSKFAIGITSWILGSSFGRLEKSQ